MPAEECADSLGRVELVTGEREKVDAEAAGIHRDGDLADALCRVRVHENAAPTGNGGWRRRRRSLSCPTPSTSD